MKKYLHFIGMDPSDFINQLIDKLVPRMSDALSKQFQPKEAEEYLTTFEVCKLLKVTQSTLFRWRKEEKIPSYGYSNKILFKRSEIEEIIKKNKLS